VSSSGPAANARANSSGGHSPGSANTAGSPPSSPYRSSSWEGSWIARPGRVRRVFTDLQPAVTRTWRPAPARATRAFRGVTAVAHERLERRPVVEARSASLTSYRTPRGRLRGVSAAVQAHSSWFVGRLARANWASVLAPCSVATRAALERWPCE
jgi:hypothetical protein